MTKYNPQKHEWGKDETVKYSKSVTPGEKKKMKSFKQFSKEETMNEAKKIASVTATDGMGNKHTINHFDNGNVSAHNQAKVSKSLSNYAFNHRGGTASAKKAVHSIVKSAKNSKELASKLNSSGLGHTNWTANESVSESADPKKSPYTYDVTVRQEKGRQQNKKDVNAAMAEILKQRKEKNGR